MCSVFTTLVFICFFLISLFSLFLFFLPCFNILNFLNHFPGGASAPSCPLSRRPCMGLWIIYKRRKKGMNNNNIQVALLNSHVNHTRSRAFARDIVTQRLDMHVHGSQTRLHAKLRKRRANGLLRNLRDQHFRRIE